MSAISSILSAVYPWSLASRDKCCSPCSWSTFCLNDPDSWATQDKGAIVRGSTHKTANLSNPSGATIHCLKYGKFVGSIPLKDKHGDGINKKPNCDYIVYSDDKKGFLYFIELTILHEPSSEEKWPKKIRRVEKEKRKQLKEMLESLVEIPEMKKFMDPFSSKRCCYFLITSSLPPPPPLESAVGAFRRQPPTHGKEITHYKHIEDFGKHGFKLWQCLDREVCQLV